MAAEASKTQQAPGWKSGEPGANTSDTERLVFFTDAVIAIAITLLVLDLQVPSVEDLLTGHISLAQALVNQWPSYLSYAIGFLIIGEFWAMHHTLFMYIKRADQGLLMINILLLVCVAFIPFTTALLARYIERPEQAIAALLYGGTLTLCCCLLNCIWWYARRRPGLLDPTLDAQGAKGITQIVALLLLMYAGATLLALVSAPVSIGLYLVLAALVALPSPKHRRRQKAPH